MVNFSHFFLWHVSRGVKKLNSSDRSFQTQTKLSEIMQCQSKSFQPCAVFAGKYDDRLLRKIEIIEHREIRGKKYSVIICKISKYMCVCKQSEKITYGKGDQLELSWKKDTQWILFVWAFDVDRFGMCFQSTFHLVGWKLLLLVIDNKQLT